MKKRDNETQQNTMIHGIVSMENTPIARSYPDDILSLLIHLSVTIDYMNCFAQNVLRLFWPKLFITIPRAT